MSVPPTGITSVSSASSDSRNTVRSAVIGDCTKASPANAIRPTRSPSNVRTRSATASFARVRRFGRRSVASMLFEVSTANMDRCPGVASAPGGSRRAAARARRTRAPRRRTRGPGGARGDAWRATSRDSPRRAAGSRCGRLRAARIASAISAIVASAPIQSHCGCAKWMCIDPFKSSRHAPQPGRTEHELGGE